MQEKTQNALSQQVRGLLARDQGDGKCDYHSSWGKFIMTGTEFWIDFRLEVLGEAYSSGANTSPAWSQVPYH